MRKFLIPVLLASVAATPAAARPHDWSDRQQSQQDNQQSQDTRQQVRQERVQQREERSASRPSFNAEARSEQLQAQPRQDVTQRQFNTGARFQPGFEGRRGSVGAERNFDAAQEQQVYAAQREAYMQQQQQQQARAAQRDQRDQRSGGERDWRQNRNWQNNDQARGQFEQRERSETGRAQAINWNRNWQNDQRYDWRHYREHHRSRFHLGIYIDPFGWNYQPYSIGYRMYSGYFGNQYWIDPAMYDLPFPPPGTAWVRYWNDAVLVDTYTGTVLDVIPGFFW